MKGYTSLAEKEGFELHFLQSRELRYCRRRDRRQSTVHRTAEFIFQIPYSRHIKRTTSIKDVVFFMCLVNTIDAIKNAATNYVHPSTSLRDAVGCTWIFPRPKKHATGIFFTSAAQRPASSNPSFSPYKNKPLTVRLGVVFMAEKEGFELLAHCHI